MCNSYVNCGLLNKIRFSYYETQYMNIIIKGMVSIKTINFSMLGSFEVFL